MLYHAVDFEFAKFNTAADKTSTTSYLYVSPPAPIRDQTTVQSYELFPNWQNKNAAAGKNAPAAADNPPILLTSFINLTTIDARWRVDAKTATRCVCSQVYLWCCGCASLFFVKTLLAILRPA